LPPSVLEHLPLLIGKRRVRRFGYGIEELRGHRWRCDMLWLLYL